jgi:heat shock protein HslJ
MKNALIILFLGLLSHQHVTAQNPVTRILYIGDAKITCNSNDMVISCLKVRPHPDSSWRGFPYEIEGFIFEPGVETMVEILETPIAFPEGNGPKFTYKLVKVLETRNTVLIDKRLLAGNKWKIINIEQDRTMLPARKANAFLEFNLDSNKITGFAGCNQLSGNSMIENGDITFGIFTSTMTSCGNDETERKIKEAMVGKAAYYIRNNILFVVCENHAILHLRPEKRLDSIMEAINKKPSAIDGNTYVLMNDGNCIVRLDYVKEVSNKTMTFKKGALTAVEKKTIRYKLVNMLPDNEVTTIYILKKLDKVTGMNYAEVIFRNGTRKTILIRNVV